MWCVRSGRGVGEEEEEGDKRRDEIGRSVWQPSVGSCQLRGDFGQVRYGEERTSSVMASSSLAEVRSSQVGMKLEGTSRRRIRGSEMAVTVIPRGAAARSARGKRSRRPRPRRGSSRYAPLPGKSINVLAVTTTHTMSKLRAIAMLPVSSEGGGDDGAVVGEGNG